jgi:hypothetical protein
MILHCKETTVVKSQEVKTRKSNLMEKSAESCKEGYGSKRAALMMIMMMMMMMMIMIFTII